MTRLASAKQYLKKHDDNTHYKNTLQGRVVPSGPTSVVREYRPYTMSRLVVCPPPPVPTTCYHCYRLSFIVAIDVPIDVTAIRHYDDRPTDVTTGGNDCLPYTSFFFYGTRVPVEAAIWLRDRFRFTPTRVDFISQRIISAFLRLRSIRLERSSPATK